jgi:hypothetical protein
MSICNEAIAGSRNGAPLATQEASMDGSNHRNGEHPP